MKKDAEVALLLHERQKGRTQLQAAARAGMSERTARNYECASALPSQLKQPRTHRTRSDPFADDWPWIVGQLERDAALQAKTLFDLLCVRHPGQYQAGQLRTLQRHIQQWRALHGPAQEVFFEQVHTPGRLAQSDFTHMNDLGVSLGGLPFPHLVYHLVLTYSNVEAISVCFAESFEALAEGLERCLWQLGGVPAQHRTDQLSAAVHQLDAAGRHDFTVRYQALMAHYGMQATTNTAGEAHQNGDVENNPTTASSWPWIRRCACAGAGISPTAAPTSVSCRSWCVSAISRASSALRLSSQRCVRCQRLRSRPAGNCA